MKSVDEYLEKWHEKRRKVLAKLQREDEARRRTPASSGKPSSGQPPAKPKGS